MSNPFTESNRDISRLRNERRLNVHRVDTVPEQDSDGLYHAEVGGEIAVFHPSVHGDLYLPPQGSLVVTYDTEEDDRLVLKALYTEERPAPSLRVGERILSHPLTDTDIHFEEDGTLRVTGQSDTELVLDTTGAARLQGSNTVDVRITTGGNVIIDDGGRRAITDVSASTTTDSDGHVTGVTINTTRSPNVYIPE